MERFGKGTAKPHADLPSPAWDKGLMPKGGGTAEHAPQSTGETQAAGGRGRDPPWATGRLLPGQGLAGEERAATSQAGADAASHRGHRVGTCWGGQSPFCGPETPPGQEIPQGHSHPQVQADRSDVSTATLSVIAPNQK